MKCDKFSIGEKKASWQARFFLFVKQMLKTLVQHKLDTCNCTDVLKYCNTLDISVLNNKQFALDFYAKLPHKPYCSFGKGKQTFIRSKSHAVHFPLIQVNPPHLINYLIFDIDASDAYLRFFDADLPVPNWISKNSKNGHCHICYSLKTPVFKSQSARMKPLRYLAAIEYSYAKKLGADLNYTGLLTKNPLDKDWQTTFLNPFDYELTELADYVDLQTQPIANKEVSGFGRNCMMFDIVRFWAYKAIREHLGSGYDGWYAEVLKEAINANTAFLSPLPYSEVKSTAKSVARWVWRNHAEAHAKFIERQAIKGRKGGLKSDSSHGGKARSAQYSDIRQEALKLHLQGLSIKEISTHLNIHRNSVSKWIKQQPTMA